MKLADHSFEWIMTDDSSSIAVGQDAVRVRAFQEQLLKEEGPMPVPPPFDELMDAAGRSVAQLWSKPCEAAFEFLAFQFPGELSRLISSNRLAPSELTFAAEAMGLAKISVHVRAALVPLLTHSSAVVREGAIYGLQKHLDAPTRALLGRLMTYEPSEGVRGAAESALNEP